MALSSGRQATSIISPPGGKEVPDCSVKVNKDAAGKSRILSISAIGLWGRMDSGQYSPGCSGTVNFIFEQSCEEESEQGRFTNHIA